MLTHHPFVCLTTELTLWCYLGLWRGEGDKFSAGSNSKIHGALEEFHIPFKS